MAGTGSPEKGSSMSPSWYIEQRQARDREGKQRRREAWLALLAAVSGVAVWWSARSFLG